MHFLRSLLIPFLYLIPYLTLRSLQLSLSNLYPNLPLLYSIFSHHPYITLYSYFLLSQHLIELLLKHCSLE